MSTTTVSARGSVAIPKAFRQQFNLKPGSKVRFVAYGGGIHLVPLPEDPIEAMQGMFAGGPAMTEELLAEVNET